MYIRTLHFTYMLRIYAGQWHSIIYQMSAICENSDAKNLAEYISTVVTAQ